MKDAVLSVSGRATAPTAAPTPHTAWCQINHCRIVGLDATHRHLIGQVRGVEVWVERPDTTSPDGVHQYGTVAVYVFSEGILPLSARDLDALRRVAETAEAYAEIMAGVR